jgi:poly(3-hydroxybutyrate) depolymerase
MGTDSLDQEITMKIRVLVVVALCALLPSAALSQALTSLSSVRVGYTTRKNTVKPTGELKAQIDALDAQIAEAGRLGRSGELRRLYAKGITLLTGRAWTDAADYSNSLVLRTPAVVVDSSKPYSVRLEQIYQPSLMLQNAVTARVALRQRPAPPAPNQPPQEPAIIKDFGTFEGVARDLRESPYFFDLELQDVADGPYVLTVDVLNEQERIGLATLAVVLRKGLGELTTRLEAAAARASEDLKPEILFPIDRMKHVNRGRLELRTFDLDRALAAAEAVAASVKSGKDPFAARTGDFKRHYRLDAANEIIPYRMYVPTGYNGTKAYPVIVALHGLGGTEDSFFDNYNRTLPPLAEQHGYILVTPLGYRVDGSYGWGLGTPPADAAVRRTQDLSEQDVMQVLQRVRKQYKIDDSRIYLMGHSMGAIGSWKIAPKFPDIWAALGPIAGSGAPATLEKIRHIPQIVVHGDADPTVPVTGSRNMVAKLKELGIEHKYIEVPGGLHSDVVAPNLAAIVEFFNTHKKSVKPQSRE